MQHDGPAAATWLHRHASRRPKTSLSDLAKHAAEAQEEAQQQQHCKLQNHPAFKAMAKTGVCVSKCRTGSCWCWQVHSYAKLTESCVRAVLKTYTLDWIFEDVRGEKVFHASALSTQCEDTLRNHFLAGYKCRRSFCERRSSQFDPRSGFSCPEHNNHLSIDRSACAFPCTRKRLIARCTIHN